ncbi:hypothetical protein MLD38_024522 [Melastoma candidum]|uniref:Uncharacterized protein n=1 Tax=Melastoma candidum TaxID=119954 RepID=A0ACB9NTJ1_9MYRT|nr:hypothetical protein MLD38_024522 [Melastoma candidum]
MSDGGNHQPRNVRTRGGDEYARGIAKVAVAQVCQNEGFQSFQQSSLETLSDVAVRYILEIGKMALLYANLAGRSQVNHFDIIHGLEDLSSVTGFNGSSEINRCLANSGVLQEISQYISDYEEIPFVYDVPRFPIDRDRKRPQSFLQIGVEPPVEHIPEWLPAFPDLKCNDVSPKESDGLPSALVYNGDVKAPQHEKSQTQLPPSNTIPFLASNGLARPSVMDNRNLGKSNETVPLNPYLSAPIRVAEEDASPATTLSKKPSWDIDEGNALEMKQNTDRNIIGSEISGPPTDMVSSKLGSSHDEEKFSCQRPCLQFKLKIGKKTNVSSRITGNWFLDERSQMIGEGDVSNDVKRAGPKDSEGIH